MRELLLVAVRERQEYGFITVNTRRELNNAGYTAAQIEAAITKLENSNG
jgi:hypothetical protein